MAYEASFWRGFRALPGNYWCAVSMTTLERIAHFGVRTVVLLHLVRSLDWRLDAAVLVIAVWGAFETYVPLVSGCYADRYGYRKSLVAACIASVIGYIGMAQAGWLAERAASWLFLLSAGLVGAGAGVLRPAIYGAIAKTATRKTAPQSWGLLYLLVNMGAFVAVMCFTWLHETLGYQPILYAAAGLMVLNLVVALRWYRETTSESRLLSEGPLSLLLHCGKSLIRDSRFLAFLLILSGFLLVSAHLFGEWLPSFVGNWVNIPERGGDVPAWHPSSLLDWALLPAVALLPVVTWIIWKRNILQIIALGMLVTLVGFVAACSTPIGWLFVLGIVVASLGELSVTIGVQAHIGLTAPSDKKATYMGCYLALPGAAASLLAMLLAVAQPSTEATPVRTYMVEHLGASKAFATDELKLPQEKTLPATAHILQHNDARAIEEALEARWAELDQEVDLLDFEKRRKAAEILDEVLGDVSDADLQQATDALRREYRPYRFALYYGAVGSIVVATMFTFYVRTRAGHAST